MTGMDGGIDDGPGLHARLVAGVKARGGDSSQVAVWAEHSYARAQQAKDVACILAPQTFSSMVLDVERVSPPPPSLPGDEPFATEPAYPVPDQESEEWESRVLALSPSAVCSRAVRSVSRVLHELRLRRLAGTAGRVQRREHARHAARRLRHTLAGLWLGYGGGGGASGGAASPAQWVLNALPAYLPTTYRALWEEVSAEGSLIREHEVNSSLSVIHRYAMCMLRTVSPRLCSRLPPGPSCPALWGASPAAAADERPLLAWTPSGSPAMDARWIRRLRPLLDVRVLVEKLSPPSSPETWTSALAASARRAVNDVIASCGSRGFMLAGTISGAQLLINQAAQLGANPLLRGIVLIAPSLNTAEGPVTLPDSPPCLVVGGSEHGARRVRLVKGADGNLILPAVRRMRHQLPQTAIDAAVAEEVALWAGELASREDPTSDDEYSHLPEASPGDVTVSDNLIVTSPTTERGQTPVKPGRTVSRIAGRTPLTLTPPARADPPLPPLASADIMTLPVVFADDKHTTTPTQGVSASSSIPTIVIDDGPITVTSGSSRPKMGPAVPRPLPANPLKYTRVIVAKRGATTPPPPPPLVVRAVRLTDTNRPQPH